MSPPDPHTQVQELRRQLQSLVEAAQANERKLDRFDALERRLMAVSSMEELVHLLLVAVSYTHLTLPTNREV